jgi:hypothetical protein
MGKPYKGKSSSSSDNPLALAGVIVFVCVLLYIASTNRIEEPQRDSNNDGDNNIGPYISDAAYKLYVDKDYAGAIQTLSKDTQQKGFLDEDGRYACDTLRILAGCLSRLQRTKEALSIFPGALEACDKKSSQHQLPILLHNYAATLLQHSYAKGGEDFNEAREKAIPLLTRCISMDPKHKQCALTLETAMVTNRDVEQKIEKELSELGGERKLSEEEKLTGDELDDL